MYGEGTLSNQINAVSFSSGSRYLACGGTDMIVKVWDLKKRSVIRKFGVIPVRLHVLSSAETGIST